MTLFDRAIEIAMTVVLIIGGYQFYFWAQRRTWFRARCMATRLDAIVTYDPRWVWVYSGLYYPMIIAAALSVSTWRDYAQAVGCFLSLLAVQVAIFVVWPTDVPPEWRVAHRIGWDGTWSQRFLDLVWSFDKLRNSLPSMHVSMATMVDLTIWREWPTLGHAGIAFPILIAVSAVKTKQHYVADVVPGAALGAAVFFGWRSFIN
jgi:membrane-associated phospholipid phosphatase